MTITPAASPTTNPTAPGGDAMKTLSGNFSTFLTLLTTQLKNQDPTSPMDSNAFTQQLVMYSQVEQQIQGNSNLKTLISQGQSSAAAMTTGYLGKKVSVTNGMASLSDGAAKWTYNLPAAASAATVTITNSSGRVVYTGAAETAAGSHELAWDGKDANGNQMPDGAYKLTVAAKDGAGANMTAAIASAGTVGQIDLTGATPQLVIGNMEVGLGDVAAVGN
jgi:flagellar basal-body rod modification protein FlgD